MQSQRLSLALFMMAVLTFIEVKIASKWIAAYYQHGIRVFFKQYKISQPEHFKLCVQRLQYYFDTRELPALDFHLLTQNLCAFRERVFFPRDDEVPRSDPYDPWDISYPGTVTVRTYRTYQPLIHGLMELDPLAGVLTVKGYLNWYPIWFAMIFSAVVLSEFSTDALRNLLVIVFLVGILVSIYVSTFVTQFRRYTEIAEFAAKSLSQGKLETYTYGT